MKKVKIIALIVIVQIAACKVPEVDLTPPTIEVISFTPMPDEDEICSTLESVVFGLEGGDELIFDLVFKDDKGLSQYKVDIHNNFDCHGHGGGTAPSPTAPNVQNQTSDWSIQDVQDISGTSVPVNRVLNVPQNVTAGNYHFHIQALDESGNDIPFANFYSLKIKNPLDAVSPVINVQQPSTNSISVKKGDPIRFVGQVTDNHSLSEGGNGILYLSNTDLSSGNTLSTNTYFQFDESVNDTFDFDFEYIVPQTLVAGNYRFSLGANDGVRNVGDFIFFDVEVFN